MNDIVKTNFQFHASVNIILEKENQVLLHRRYNTGWEDGKYVLPGGHLDGGESIKTAAIREAKEEIGINITEEDLDLVHVLHILTDNEYLAYFVRANKWEGEPMNTEPQKCDDMQWFQLNQLPENTVPHFRNVLNHYKNGIMFSEEGFN